VAHPLDKSAAEQALSQHLDYVYTICIRMTGDADDAQDASQETFLKAFKKWRTYDQGRELKNWLAAIAINTCKDLFRRRSRIRSIGTDDAEALSDKGRQQDSLDKRLLGERMLDALPFEYRSVMVLFYLEERSILEISGILKIPTVLVKVRLYRARNKLMECFK
jgi:RNA polymerase sigma-70 factor (ECF subfamily)